MGLISMYYAYSGNYVTSSWVILYSTILDKLDGSAARFLDASSEFGEQFDSFSDFVAFGIAPMFLVFSICMNDPRISVIFSETSEPPFFLFLALIFYVLASALRLARFNIASVPGSSHMFGMATTVAGGLVATYVLICYAHINTDFFVKILQRVPYFLLILAALEVSSLPIVKIGYRTTPFSKFAEFASIPIALFCVLTRSLPELLFLMAVAFLVAGFTQGYRQRDQIRAAIRELENAEHKGEED